MNQDSSSSDLTSHILEVIAHFLPFSAIITFSWLHNLPRENASNVVVLHLIQVFLPLPWRHLNRLLSTQTHSGPLRLFNFSWSPALGNNPIHYLRYLIHYCRQRSGEVSYQGWEYMTDLTSLCMPITMNRLWDGPNLKSHLWDLVLLHFQSWTCAAWLTEAWPGLIQRGLLPDTFTNTLGAQWAMADYDIAYLLTEETKWPERWVKG